jgi:hypothetical protein
MESGARHLLVPGEESGWFAMYSTTVIVKIKGK